MDSLYGDEEFDFGDSRRTMADFAFLKHEEWNLSQFAASVHETGFFEGKVGRTVGPLESDANVSDAAPACSALHIAAKAGFDDIVSLCLRTIDANLQDHMGFTALHYATASRNRSTVSLLVDSGASVLVTSKAGSTALDLAKALKFDDICDILESKTSIEQDPNLPAFRAWLVALGALEHLPRFISAGYDLSFIAKHGLAAEDLDCIGIPKEKLGVRRKLMALHNLKEYFTGDEEEEEEGDDEEGDEDEEEEEEDEDE